MYQVVLSQITNYEPKTGRTDLWTRNCTRCIISDILYKLHFIMKSTMQQQKLLFRLEIILLEDFFQIQTLQLQLKLLSILCLVCSVFWVISRHKQALLLKKYTQLTSIHIARTNWRFILMMVGRFYIFLYALFMSSVKLLSRTVELHIKLLIFQHFCNAKYLMFVSNIPFVTSSKLVHFKNFV